MATTKNMIVKFTAEAKDIESTLARVRSQFSGVQSTMAGIIGGLGISEALNKGQEAWDKIADTIKNVADQGKHAKALGASVEGYSGLLYAAGDNAESLDKALFKLNDTIGNALIEGGAAEKVFDRLGIKLDLLANKQTDKQFLEIAGALAKIDNAAIRNKDAKDIFGKGALDILPLIQKGQDGLQKMMDKARERGFVVSEKEVAIAKEANLAIKEMNTSTTALWRDMAVVLAPAIKSVAEDFKKLKEVSRDNQVDLSEADEISQALIQWKEMAKDASRFADLAFAGPKAMFSGFDKDSMQEWGTALDRFIGSSGSALERAKEGMRLFKEQTNEASKVLRDMHDYTANIGLAKDPILPELSDMFKRKFALLDEAMGPLERIQNKLEEINKLNERGAFIGDEHAKVMGHLVNEIERAGKANGNLLAPGLELGSVAEYSSRVQSQTAASASLAPQTQHMASILDTMKREEQRNIEKGRDFKELMNDVKALKGDGRKPVSWYTVPLPNNLA